MASLDTIPSVLGTTPAALGADSGPNQASSPSLWMKGIFWVALALLAWGGIGYLLKGS